MVNIFVDTVKVQVTKWPGNVLAPKYHGDAGYDLVVAESTPLEPGKLTKVDCGVRVALPEGISALVIGRSSSVTNLLLVVTTLIDSGYRGDLFAFVYNMGPAVTVVNAGDRLAQLVPIQSCSYEVEHVDVLPESHRGTNGFGSSGK